MPVPRVETAQLSLAAIMAKFPDELRKLVLKMPGAEAMVVMPLPTIQKSLPTGSVKMSLASVVRQAPAGTFSTINPQDKRMVEVPLAEIFKRIPPALLKKRADQKYSDLAAEGFDIFGDEENPHALAPRVEGSAQVAPPPAPRLAPAPAAAPKVLQMPPGMVAAPPPNVPAPFAEKFAAQAAAAAAPQRASSAPPPEIPQLFARQSTPAQVVSPPAAKPAPAPARPAAPAAEIPPLVLPIADLIANWPEPIKSEAAALNGATVSLPSADVSSGLAKGKVAFAWGDLRRWITPAPTGESHGGDTVELLLPLRVIAPAFLKHTKAGSAPRKAAEVGDIPELFAGGTALRPPTEPAPRPEIDAAPVPEPQSEPQSEPQPEPAPVAEAEAEPIVAPPAAVAETPVEAEAPHEIESVPSVESEPAEPAAPAEIEPPAAEVQPPVQELTPEPATASEQSAIVADEAATEAPSEIPTEEVAQEVVIAPAPEITPASAAAPAVAAPKTLGEAFGQPDKTSWVPSEVVKHLADVPGIAGSLVALQEGLVIAHRLPDPLKGEVFAAFLPQIFARLNQYSGEMKLGGVSEIVIHANGGPCHLFRRGQVYFAALGHPDATLPMPLLRLCADAVAS